jgi:dTDP-4-dehydrorhamnose 3,5-epimerase
MHFEPLAIGGAALVGIEQNVDSRGFFARTFWVSEFAAAGLPTQAVQASVSSVARAKSAPSAAARRKRPDNRTRGRGK